jgi:hypothetical protein
MDKTTLKTEPKKLSLDNYKFNSQNCYICGFPLELNKYGSESLSHSKSNNKAWVILYHKDCKRAYLHAKIKGDLEVQTV